MSSFKILPGVLKESVGCDLCFAFLKGSLLVRKIADELKIVTFDEIKKLNMNYESEFFLGEIGEKSCFTVDVLHEVSLPEQFEFIPLHEIGMLMEENIFEIAGRASEILTWNRNHRFCGRCGTKTEDKKDEMAKICPKCGNIMYPVICPAVIVAITKGDKILLAHNSGFKDNRYSLIAGFVEAGENLKSAVKREVFEEVGIKVKNIRYYKSSPWPFPNSLMVGFFAEYDSGEIKVDGNEILDADWFSKGNMPNLPNKYSLARKIINEFVSEN